MRRFVSNVLCHSRCSAQARLGLRWRPTNTLPASATASAASPTWWKADTHEYSTISGDARADLGVISAKAEATGHDAVFLTDHDRAASFSIDQCQRWDWQRPPTVIPIVRARRRWARAQFWSAARLGAGLLAISGGYLDDLTEDYDDLQIVGKRLVGKQRATVMSGKFLRSLVKIAIWREDSVTATM